MPELEDAYPLSPVQSGMLLHSIHEDPLTYVNQTVLLASGELRVDLLERAWRAVSARHPALRSAFVWADMDEPVQVVLTEAELPFDVIQAPMDGHGPVEEFLRTDRIRGFELGAAPLMRLTVLTSASDPWRLVWTWHHLILDGWSGSIVVDEVVHAYEALLDGAEPRFEPVRPYRDYVAWLAEQDMAEAECFWRDALDGFEAPAHFGAAHGGAAPAARYGQTKRMLSTEATAKVASFARTRGLTLNTVVQGSFALLLSRYTGEDDVCFGITSSGRPAAVDGVEAMVGMFLSTTPLRVAVDPLETTAAMLARLQRDQAAARQYEYAALAKIQGWSAGGAGRSLFDALLVMQNYPESEWTDSARLRLDEEVGIGQTNLAFTLNAFVIEDRLGFLADHDRGRFGDDMVAQMLGHLDELLCQMAATPDAPVGALRLSATGAVAPVEPQQAVSARSLSWFVEEFAQRRPGADAVVFDERRLTYAELNARADRFAGLLKSRGAAPGNLVGIALERSPEIMVAALGVFKAGCAYVPVDPFQPTPRIASIIADSGAALVVTNQAVAERFDGLCEEHVLVVVDERDAAADYPDAEPAEAAGHVDPAVFIYTSGAPGRPMGTVLTHGAVSSAAQSLARTMALNSQDRVLDLDSRLDLSIPALFTPLTVGAALILRSERHLGGAEGLRQACATDRVSAVVASGGHWTKLVAPAYTSPAAPRGVEDRLRVVVITGNERIPAAQAHSWVRDMPGVGLVRSYGPIESARTALVRDVAECGSADLETLTGRPADGLPVEVRDKGGRRLPTWLPGALQVNGANQAGVRARRLPDGCIELLGRSDERVEIGGFPVDTAEIRAALLTHPSVADCAVVAVEETPRRLVAFVTAPQAEEPRAAQLRAHIRATLPDHFAPSAIVVLDAVPRSASGRLLRSALPEIGAGTCPESEFDDLPASAVEGLLAEVWARSLGMEAVGRHQNFFELGGDSIALIRVIGEAAQRGVRVTPRQVFENQTVAALAQVAVPVEPIQGGHPAEDGPVAGVVPLLPVQRWFFEQGVADVDLWNTEFAYAVRAEPGLVRRAVEAVVLHHDAFRLRFRRTSDGWEQSIPSNGVDGSSESHGIFEYCDLSSFSPPEQQASMVSAAWEAHRAVNLVSGPTVRFVQFHLSEREPDLLFAAIHHLVFDGVSALILREDLETALTRLSRGEAAALPAKTTSYQEWSRRLLAYAESTAPTELDHWRSLAGAGPIPLPESPVDEAPEQAAFQVVTLPSEESRLLFGQVPRALGAQTLELLLAALVRAMRTWADSPFLVELEGHGREDLFEGVDLSRTVGWFTSQFPVLLGADRPMDPVETLARVREQLRAVPNHGIGYGILRYLAAPEIRAELAELPEARIAFGYLGQIDTVDAPGGRTAVDPVLESTAVTVVVEDDSPEAQDRYRSSADAAEGIGVGLWVENGMLTARFTYSPRLAKAALDRSLADRYLDALRELIACAAPELRAQR